MPDVSVSVTFPPEQKEVGPDGVMAGDGVGFTETTTAAYAVQPDPFVTATE